MFEDMTPNEVKRFLELRDREIQKEKEKELLKNKSLFYKIRQLFKF